jgi:hypothetical protein
MNNDENMRIAQRRYDNMEKPDQEVHPKEAILEQLQDIYVNLRKVTQEIIPEYGSRYEPLGHLCTTMELIYKAMAIIEQE